MSKDVFRPRALSQSFASWRESWGYLDGAVGDRDWASTAHIAKLLDLPIVLVVDCGKLSRSVAAIVHGYRSFDPELNIAGVILNHVSSDRHRDLLKQALKPLNIRILGVLGRHEPIQLPDRYLGLVPTDELQGFDEITEKLADLGDRCLDWTALKPLLQSESELFSPTQIPLSHGQANEIRIAIARDAAFNFYYEDNLDSLRALGAELVPWSPLKEKLPDNIYGLLLGGGFPEQFADRLSQNHSARKSLKRWIEAGLPTYAECGGLMYLCDELINFDGKALSNGGSHSQPSTNAIKIELGISYRPMQPSSGTTSLGWKSPGTRVSPFSTIAVQHDAAIKTPKLKSTLLTFISRGGWTRQYPCVLSSSPLGRSPRYSATISRCLSDLPYDLDRPRGSHRNPTKFVKLRSSFC